MCLEELQGLVCVPLLDGEEGEGLAPLSVAGKTQPGPEGSSVPVLTGSVQSY